jgi:hypothetical protein
MQQKIVFQVILNAFVTSCEMLFRNEYRVNRYANVLWPAQSNNNIVLEDTICILTKNLNTPRIYIYIYIYIY